MENKNIFLLPTENQTRLALIEGRILEFDKFVPYLSGTGVDGIHTQCQYIYITNDEDIKEGSIVLSTYDKWEGTSRLKPVAGKVIEIHEDGYLIKYYSEHFGETQSMWDKGHSKIIILTNNPELVKDDVQPIPDEFLEWFVKNPKCESIEVKKECCGQCDERLCEVFDLQRGWTKTNTVYRIILPKDIDDLEEARKIFKESIKTKPTPEHDHLQGFINQFQEGHPNQELLNKDWTVSDFLIWLKNNNFKIVKK